MIEPLYKSEPKSVRIRKANKPQYNPCIGGSVAITCSGWRGKVYIRYNEALVDYVGKHLPMGVCPEHPAFMKLVNVPGTDTWRFYALYPDKSALAFLWQYDTCPAWANLPKNLR